MYKIKAFLLFIIAIPFTQQLIAQNNTNSPYTRFGYGEISDNNSIEQRAMGGVAIGARAKDRINTVNPASYSSVDSLTFMFDIGFSGLLSSFYDREAGRKTTFNGNLEYLALQFRLFKGVGFSAGLLPYSFSGYDFHSTDSLYQPSPIGDPTKVKYTSTYYGSGGFSQFYAGLSVDLLNHVSLGANMYYMFGNYSNVRSLDFTNTSNTSSIQVNSIKANNLRFRYGLQVYNTFSKKHDVTLGVIYETKTNLNADASKLNSGQYTDTISFNKAFELPQTFGGGLYYTYDNKLSFGLDYSLQQWGDVMFFGESNTLNDRWKISLGGEYQPDFRARKYAQRMIYRAGLNITNPYYQFENETPGKNFGITFGLGFPLRRSRTMINMALEYGKIASYSALTEDYFKISINLGLTETWFRKLRL